MNFENGPRLTLDESPVHILETIKSLTSALLQPVKSVEPNATTPHQLS